MINICHESARYTLPIRIIYGTSGIGANQCPVCSIRKIRLGLAVFHDIPIKFEHSIIQRFILFRIHIITVHGIVLILESICIQPLGYFKLHPVVRIDHSLIRFKAGSFRVRGGRGAQHLECVIALQFLIRDGFCVNARNRILFPAILIWEHRVIAGGKFHQHIILVAPQPLKVHTTIVSRHLWVAGTLKFRWIYQDPVVAFLHIQADCCALHQIVHVCELIFPGTTIHFRGADADAGTVPDDQIFTFGIFFGTLIQGQFCSLTIADLVIRLALGSRHFFRDGIINLFPIFIIDRKISKCNGTVTSSCTTVNLAIVSFSHNGKPNDIGRCAVYVLHDLQASFVRYVLEGEGANVITFSRFNHILNDTLDKGKRLAIGSFALHVSHAFIFTEIVIRIYIPFRCLGLGKVVFPGFQSYATVGIGGGNGDWATIIFQHRCIQPFILIIGIDCKLSAAKLLGGVFTVHLDDTDIGVRLVINISGQNLSAQISQRRLRLFCQVDFSIGTE